VPGLVTVIVLLVTCQVNVADPVAPVSSVASTVTVLVAAAVGLPEMTPLALLIDSPAGSPVALQVSA
jgi:hypothetical protein